MQRDAGAVALGTLRARGTTNLVSELRADRAQLAEVRLAKALEECHRAGVLDDLLRRCRAKEHARHAGIREAERDRERRGGRVQAGGELAELFGRHDRRPELRPVELAGHASARPAGRVLSR